MIYRKKLITSNTNEVVKDLRYAYELLCHPKYVKNLYAITITDTNTKHEKDLSFTISNKVFNKLNKEYKTILNYLFVIEYNEIVSLGIYIPDKVKVHTHIVVNTDINVETIKDRFNYVFPYSDIYFEDITLRNDRDIYINYLTKQGVRNKILTSDNYNYKITFNPSRK